MPKLVIDKGSQRGRSVVLGDRVVFVGCDGTADLRLHETTAADRHFKVEKRADGYYLHDLGSPVGTFLNGVRVTERRLTLGDRISVGETILSYVEDMEAAQSQALIGQTLGGYKILERIGRGGMGSVFKATQLSLNRTVALKLLAAEFVKDRSFIDRFILEARAAAALNHPNVVGVYDVKRIGDLFYIAMEYMPGGSVQDLLAKEKKLPAPLAMKIVLDALRGLQFAEKKGIVHRDIKPDNLLIGEGDIIKICDLGLAKRFDPSQPQKEEHGIFGTPHYIAPEQVMGKNVDHRADLYSLGATLYRMVGGVTPYNAPTIKELLIKKIKEDPPAVTTYAPELPPKLVDVLNKLSRRNPDERYASATQAIADLEELARPPGTSTSASGLTPVPAAPPSKAGLIAAAALGVLLLAGGIGWKFMKGPGAPPPGPEPGVRPPPVDPGTEALRRAKLAEERWSSADYILQHCATDRNVADLEKALKILDGILADCKDTARAGDAARLKSEIEARIQNGRGLVRLDAVLRDRAAADRQFEITHDTTGLSRLVEALKGIIADSPDAPVVTDARRELKRIVDRLERYKNVREGLGKMEHEADALVGQGKFTRALEAVGAFARTHAEDLPMVAREVKDLEKRINAAADAVFDPEMTRAQALEADGKLQEAVKVLEGIEKKTDVPRHLQAAAEMKERISNLILETNEEIIKAMKAADKALLTSSRVQAANLFRLYQYTDAYGILKDAAGRMKMPEYMSEAKARAESVAALARCKAAVIARINKKGLKDADLRLKSLPGAKVTGANDEKIEITVPIEGGGSMGTEKEWHEVEPLMFYRFARSNLAMSPEDTLDWAVFCLEMAIFDKTLYSTVEKPLEEAEKAAMTSESRPLADRCRGLRLQQEHLKKIGVNEEVFRRGEYIQALRKEQKWQEAKDELDRLEWWFSDSRYYIDNKAKFFDDWKRECEGMIDKLGPK